MTDIERAAAKLVEKMAGMELNEWYEDYYHMLASAFTHPQENVVGSELGDIIFFAMCMVFEISEIGDAVYQLPEYQELLELMEEAGLVRDRQKMSDQEYKEDMEEIFPSFPAEENEEILQILNQRIRPN